MKPQFAIVMTLFTLLIPHANAAKRKHQSARVTVSVLSDCSTIPKDCPMNVDPVMSCKAVFGKQSLEEGAHDSDNAACVKLRLQKKICAKGWVSEKFKVTCR